MQQKILKYRNRLMIVSGILIVVAFLGKKLFSQTEGAEVGLLLAAILAGTPILVQAFQALRVKVVSIDLLVTIAIIGALVIQNNEEAAVVAFLFLFGAYLEQRTLAKTRSAIKDLVDLAPDRALKRNEAGKFVEVAVDEVDVGDRLLVKTGGKIPVDGSVLIGSGQVNEASITGEAKPAKKQVANLVYAGTILTNGTLQIRADKVGEDTTFGKIIELVEEAQDSKSEAERFIDHFAKYYTPFILVLALFVGLMTKDLELAITILVLGCPGALVIGIPVSNVAGIGNGARHGILLKGSESISRFSQVDTMLFDKTGTLTIGNPQVTDDIFYGNDRQKANRLLASVEAESDHPLAKAITTYLNESELFPVKASEVVAGGIKAKVANRNILIGNHHLLEEAGLTFTNEMIQDMVKMEEQGNSIVWLAVNDHPERLIGIRDPLRPGVKEELAQLKKLGVKKLVMLSGDNQTMVNQVSADLNLSAAIGQMFPSDKADYVTNFQKEGEIVAFVGDGVNDSPSLAAADIGIAMGNGTDVAIETSDVVLMNSEFQLLPHALGLAKAVTRNRWENIIVAIAVVLILLLSLFFSNWMNMAIGMLVHEGSILVVIINGMRLLKYSLKS